MCTVRTLEPFFGFIEIRKGHFFKGSMDVTTGNINSDEILVDQTNKHR